MAYTPTDVASSLMYVLPNLMQQLAHYMKEGGTFSQLQLRSLMWLKRQDACRMSDLAERFDISRPAMTACIQALVSRGLARRQHRPDDRRVVEIVVTAAGEAEIEAWELQVHQALEQALEQLSASEAQVVVDAMAVLATAFGIEEWAQSEASRALAPSCKERSV